MNKILKDGVVRSRSMMGFDAPYVPGWDCHGLPIEQKVDKQLGPKKRELDTVAIRQACREYAQKFIDIQREEFRRLGVGGNWKHPYVTMGFAYEADIARAFGAFYERDLLFRDLKSVRWCFTDRTALAEAELEYEEKTDPAIYVAFPGSLRIADRTIPDVSFLIWTTTPWTIPSNVAIAVHPEEIYAVVEASGRRYVVAQKRLETVASDLGWAGWTVEATVPGADLAGARYAHPLPPGSRGELTPEEEASAFRVVLGPHVTMDAGTGLVHTAPGHGEDDFVTGKREGLPILSPVDAAGRFTAVEKYRGKKVLDANDEIIEDLRAAGALLNVDRNFRHEYPHCWRCKKPVIFRATIQWFVRLDDPKTDVRAAALAAIRRVEWIPPWGEARIAGMVENRREWVVSRQRRWGSPITVLFAMRDGERAEVYPWKDSPEEQKRFFDRVASVFAKEGGDAWYARPAEDFLPEGADRRGYSEFQKETDILDVWFDSGVSHIAVLRSGQWPELTRGGDGPPADMYLEGHDQHRGWFQSSLLTSVALYGDAPYRAVITHGFFQDVSGRKMSKSLGNVVEPQELIRRYGADILRLWVFSLDYRDDTPISEEILARCAEAYRKIRNTARYLISNLYDFDPARDAVAGVGPAPARCLGAPRDADRARPGPRGLRPVRLPRRLPHARQPLRHDAVGRLPRRHQGPSVCLRCPLLAAPVRPDRDVPDRPGDLDDGGPRPRFHGGRNLEGAAGKEGRIGPPGRFREPGRVRLECSHGSLDAPDAIAGRSRRDPRGGPAREDDRLLPRGRDRPDATTPPSRPTGPPRERPGAPSPTSSSSPRSSRSRPPSGRNGATPRPIRDCASPSARRGAGGATGAGR